MNTQQANIFLEKINNLFKNMQSGSVSAIERDLMLGYIRRLYESFLADESAPVPVSAVKINVPKKEEEVQAYTPPRIIVVPDMEPEPVVAPPPRIIAVPPSVAAEMSVTEIVAEPQPLQPVAAPEQLRWQSPRDIQETETNLFEQKDVTLDPSERLTANQPIENLHSALSINEKIATLNDLFGGDHAAFNETLGALNSMMEFEQAKELLKKMAFRYDWASAAKEPKAKNFIKIVRRKFL